MPVINLTQNFKAELTPKALGGKGEQSIFSISTTKAMSRSFDSVTNSPRSDFSPDLENIILSENRNFFNCNCRFPTYNCDNRGPFSVVTLCLQCVSIYSTITVGKKNAEYIPKVVLSEQKKDLNWITSALLKEAKLASSTRNLVSTLKTCQMTFKELKCIFHVGAVIEVLWASKEYNLATVVEVKHMLVKVHYDGWESNYDEWIGINSNRLRALKSPLNVSRIDNNVNVELKSFDIFKDAEQEKTEVEELNDEIQITEESKINFEIGMLIEVFSCSKFYPAKIIKIKVNSIKVHYRGWNEKFDEWIGVNSDRIRVCSVIDVKSTRRKHKDLLELNPDQINTNREQLNVAKINCETDLLSSTRWKPQNNAITQSYRELQQFLQIGSLVQVLWASKEYYVAEIVEIKSMAIKIHYPDWGRKYDEWLGINSSRLKFVNLPKIDTATMNIPEKKNSTQKLRKEGSGLSEKENALADLFYKNFLSSTRKRNRQEFNREMSINNLKQLLEVGNVVEVLWASKTYYPAVVIEAKCSEVKVHYLGWDIKFDEWIGMNSIRFKFNEKNENILNNENYELEKKLIKKRIKTKRDSEEVEEVYSEDDTDTKKYFCNDCKSQIKKYTYNCFYCSYYLCVNCFQTNYKYHKHPKTSFSMRRVFNKKIRDSVTSKEIELKFVKDNFFLHFNENDTENLTKFAFFNIGSFKKSLQYEKICGFCNTDSTSFSQFFKFPLVIKSEYNDIDEITKLVWVHIYCAKYSPEVVYFDHLNEWFNIFEAVKRASKIKCFNCKGRGASIGCFDKSCFRSFHIECTKKPLSHWENGVVFWCPEHEALLNMNYIDKFSCDGCSIELNKERTWYTCQPCSLTYYSTYDLCHKCFGRNSEITHTHSLDSFIETDISARTQAKNEIDNETLLEVSKIYEKRDQFQRKNKCWYCHTDFSIKWNKFEGVLLCYDCSEIPLISSNKKANCNIFVNEDESKLGTRYLTRKMMNTSAELGDSAPQLLKDYGPDDDKLFSCVIDSSFFDLKGRATKWANHSSMDYSGTWLPHLVRWAIIRYSKKNDLILSNFLGRGTDIIESFILERRSVGVDINPRAVKLAQKNLYFKLPLDKKHNIPSLFLGNSTNLKELGDVFSNENFDLILSHPPYKDCIKYSEDIIGDLSLLSEMEEFLVEIDSVAQESNRLLKDGGRCFFGMGDNRKKKIYQAISFESILKYLGRGFEIEEFIVKRLRHTAAGGLGSYFSTTYDILMFHHEFLVVFKKKIHCPNETSVLEANCMKILTRSDKTIDIPVKKELRILPKKPLKEPCGMGTVWNFSSKTDLPIMAMARILERFGSEGEIWEQVDLKEFELQLMKYIVADEMCTEREELGEVIHVRNGEYSLEARRIESSKENEKMLNDLGLSYNTLTDLGQEKLFLQKILNEKQKINSNEQMKVHLKFIPHLNFASTSIFNNTTWIKNYQNFIKNEAIEFLNNVKNYERFNAKLEEYRFIVGVKDVRGYEDEELLMEIEKEENAAIIDIENIQNFNKKIGEKQFKFFPMSVLIYKELMSLKLDLKEIIQRKTLSFKFKELLIVVPDGYEKVRIDIEELKLRSMENDLEFKNERNGGRLRALPIVHAFYFVFAPEERTVC